MVGGRLPAGLGSADRERSGRPAWYNRFGTTRVCPRECARFRLARIGTAMGPPPGVSQMPQVNALKSVSREKLLHALYEAAELEQNLMCTYLYAAFSLRDGEAEGLSGAETEAVARWRRVILDVAIDEMSHLVAVWNITSAHCGAPRFGRTNFPLAPGPLPAGLSLKLAPFCPAVSQYFIFLERSE